MQSWKKWLSDNTGYVSILDSIILWLVFLIFDLIQFSYLFVAISIVLVYYSSVLFRPNISLIKSAIFSAYLGLLNKFLLFFVIPYLFISVFPSLHKSSNNNDLLESKIQEIVWNATDDLLFVKGPDLRYRAVNKALEEFYAMESSDIIGKSDYELFDEKDAKIYVSNDKRIIKSRQSETVFTETLTHGQMKNMMTIKQPIFDNDGELVAVFGIARDVTELYKMREEVIKGNELVNNIFQHSPDAIFVKSTDGVYIKVNPAFADVHGKSIEELEGKTDYDLFSEVVARNFIETDKEIFETGELNYNQSTIMLDGKRQVSGTIKAPLRNSEGEITAIMGIAHDLTPYSELENKIIESQKMDSITNLAAGFAHDLNNVLSGVLGYSSLLEVMELNQEGMIYVQNIISATKQATELISKLMLFTSQHKSLSSPLIETVDVNDQIKNVFQIIKPSVQKNIQFEFDLSDIPSVRGDSSQINQMIMNLLVNAVEAITDKGTISVMTSSEEVYEFAQFKFVAEELHPGTFVKIIVADTGKGIPETVQKRIFEPFYSTKEGGSKKGTGLGLAIVYGVVTNMSGILDFTSEVGKGTQIEIFLPSSDEVSSVIKLEDKLVFGSGTVLCIDDEEIIHTSLGSMLAKLGYQLISAKTGSEGIDIYRQEKDKINCIILDLTMPGMNGREVFGQLRKLNTDAKIILSTGYGKHVEIKQLEEEGIENILTKPYSIYHLSRILAKVISAN